MFRGLGPLACSDSELTSELRILLNVLVGLLVRGIGPSQDLSWHRTAQYRKNEHTAMPRTEFEPAVPLLKRSKIIHTLYRAATGTGIN